MQDQGNIVYLNGEFLPLRDARVSVMDRGFLFGDGVYEVIPCFSGRLFRLSKHLDRLDRSLRGIRMENSLSHRDWREVLEKLIQRNPGTDQSLYLQVTRGSAGLRVHAIPEHIEPTVFAMSTRSRKLDPVLAEQGIQAVTLDDIRWKLCNIKTITLLANILLRQEARDNGAREAILIRNGLAIEGAASNLFIVKGNLIITPPNGPFLLPGVTRDLVMELAQQNQLPFLEADIRQEQLTDADEIWLTSSTMEIMPVTRLDGKPIANGLPGPMYQRVSALYATQKEKLETRKP